MLQLLYSAIVHPSFSQVAISVYSVVCTVSHFILHSIHCSDIGFNS